ncbi:hypothetical protein NP233_g109 [Leucocoprinus birnbaumii]|uniref:Nephrocystin 3-like N-terminal domain-containing protein n=1 Tax=Leucocoprinus birnbaumii TaxID=56174 RepID=A0AAD5W2R2_9AGAR|nr:hypothetical protein NP233_g109 [Leucocoprinus birnbaumii]
MGASAESTLESEGTPPADFFPNASNFVVQHQVMVGTATITNTIASGNTVLQHLSSHTNPDAAADSSARWPPPSCHPGTRLSIINTLMNWLDDVGRQWPFIWLYGSAGCGKSAVAQTFADRCLEMGRLGASFFFSRPNNRNDPKTVVPTLAYQLATHCPEYKVIITTRLAEDPQLLDKAIPVQFKKLIVEPFSYLQRHKPECVREPFVILLDGLDECKGERVQCEIIKLIDEYIRVKQHDLPLIWLICSRPEAHLHHTFARIVNCGRFQLVIDDECRDDVERYLRDGFFKIQIEFNLESSWPSPEEFKAVLRSGDGHFIFAATALGFVGDDDYANPQNRLAQLISFLDRANFVGAANPLAKLDFLYTQILSDIPDDIFPITWRILAHFIYTSQIHPITDRHAKFLLESAQALCNFVHIKQSEFYGALRKLYSVIDIPAPEKAGTTPIRFYHASFQDFLVDGSRSGRFVIERKEAFVDITQTLLYWNQIDSQYFHHTETELFYRTHEHETLPVLKWSSGPDVASISKSIARFASSSSWAFWDQGLDNDTKLLSFLLGLDLRHLRLEGNWVRFVNNQYEKVKYSHLPTTHLENNSRTSQDVWAGYYRTEPSNNFDVQLLDFLALMVNKEPVQPAPFPLPWSLSLIDTDNFY